MNGRKHSQNGDSSVVSLEQPRAEDESGFPCEPPYATSYRG